MSANKTALPLSLFLFFLSFTPSALAANCAEAYEKSREVYREAENLLREKDNKEVPYYVNRILLLTDEAMNLAYNCGCPKAFSSIEEVKLIAYKAKSNQNLGEVQSLAKRMVYFTDEAITFSEMCSN